MSNLPKYSSACRFAVILSTFILCFSSLLAQNETNIWYFGYGAGIDFNSGSPVAISSGVLNTNEGSASICDENGTLLFYSDGITVWNASHLVMPNGSGLSGGWSTTQSAIIVQQPQHNNIYYLFSQGPAEASPVGSHFNYSKINMNLGGGLGDVEVKNMTLTNTANERNTVVPHSNNEDFWIISNYGSQFFAYLLTSTGINTTPVISNIGPVLNNPRGYMKSDPAGNRIAIAAENFTVLYNFDRTSGLLSSPMKLKSMNYVYGLEFSPDGSKLYVNSRYPEELWQYDLEIGSQNEIINSIVKVGSCSYAYGALQLGPDQRIYIASENNPYLDCIANPNAKGDLCDYRSDALFLDDRLSALGLPNHSPYLLKSAFTYTYGCPGTPVKFELTDVNSVISAHWNFGDPVAADNESTLLNPTHLFASPGTYTVMLILTYNGSTDTIIRKISIGDLQTICHPPSSTGYTFQVYPNPSNGHFMVSYYFEAPDATMKVYDVLGRLVHTQVFPDQFGNTELNLAFLNQAIYVWTISTAGKQVLGSGKLNISR